MNAKSMSPSFKMGQPKIIIGWREWVGLPELGVTGIKAKLDTGARTSSIHAFNVTQFDKPTGMWVSFVIHPVQGRKLPEIACSLPVLGRRVVTSSNGARETRYVVKTSLGLGGMSWPIELTLTNRDEMGFRMLIGREAMRRRVLVDPGKSYQLGRFTNKDE